MTYLLLSAGFIVVALAVALLAGGLTRIAGWGLLLGGVALLVLTAVFDSVMIGAGLFTYDDAHLVGTRVGLAPIEDFAYPVAALILLPALWVGLRRRRHDR